ncbi:hypothetical protein EQU24_20435 [Methylotuvimicrobium buryatense]|uniref:Uncharacterized protein n=1 Tax=Methylotuvimicrobium buryatense TaxID=95641 RepID=A0A4P9US48_METBY|nr:hypothetical protein [Methylotuvimicrobium buryatense]QCW84334.1 hypothetical protein EQU24_20435 [Methylotuvimicrobium buryatense]
MSFVAGSVTRLTGRREYVRVGLTAAFLAADTCQSSYRTCLPCINNKEVIYDQILNLSVMKREPA